MVIVAGTEPPNQRDNNTAPHAERILKRNVTAHSLDLMCRTLGVNKTLKQVMNRCYWPGVHKEVMDYCAS